MSNNGENKKPKLSDLLNALMEKPVELLVLLMLAIQNLIKSLGDVPEIDVTYPIREEKLSDYLNKIYRRLDDRIRVHRLPEEKKEIQKLAKGAILLNKVYFRSFFKGMSDLLAEVLQAITGKPHIEIKSLETEVDFTRADGSKGAIMDLVSRDSDRTVYDTEAQTVSANAPIGRAAHNLDTLGVYALEKGKEDSEMPEAWCIFICQYDVFGERKLLYHEQMAHVPGTDRYLRHIVYLNCSYKKEEATCETGLPAEQEKELLTLIHDFCQGDPNKMICDSFKKRAIELTTPDGRGWTKLEEEFDRFLALEKQKVREEVTAAEAAKLATLAQQMIADMHKRGLAHEDIEHYEEMFSGAIQPARVAI